MRFFSFITSTVVALSGVALTACSPGTAQKVGQILRDPTLQVGMPSEQASKATITIYAEPGANQTDYGQAPVDVWIFELTDPDELMATDFISLTEQPVQSLGTSYVKHHKKQVTGGQSTVFAPFDLDKRTTYIGVAVGYANIDRVNWRASERVNPKGENYSIMIPITKKKVAIQLHR